MFVERKGGGGVWEGGETGVSLNGRFSKGMEGWIGTCRGVYIIVITDSAKNNPSR